MLSLHRIRSLLVKFRTMQVNQLRGLLYEFGASFRAGRVAGLAEIRARMAELEEALPGAMMCCLQDQLRRIDGLQTEIDHLELRIGALAERDAACSAIARVPGIGKLTATALVATMGKLRTFKSGREFAAFLGVGAPPERHGRQGSTRVHIEARGSLPAHVAHPWRAIFVVSREDADSMAECNPSATTRERRGRCRCEQDGSNGVGDPGSGSGVPARSREPEACIAGRTKR